MALNQREASEISFGLVLKAKEAGDDISGMFNPESFAEPYNRALKDVPKMEMQELKATHGFDAMRSAEYAAEDEDVDTASKWAVLLERLANYTGVGKKLVRIGNRLQEGQNNTGGELLTLAAQLDKGESGFVSLDSIKALSLDEVYVPSYLELIDENAGGWPKAGMTVIAGPAKLGKSTLLMQALAAIAKQEKYSALFSLEMPKELVKFRMNEMRLLRSKRQMQYILMDDQPMDADQMYAAATRLMAEYDLHMIGVDYAGKLVHGAESEEAVGAVSNVCSTLARVSGVPVVVISGVSRGYVGGEPMVNHIRYSGRWEHDASLICLVYNPELLEVDMINDKRGLPYVPGHAYLKFGAARIGMKKGTLGAALVKWNDKKGMWGNSTVEWMPKLVG